MGLASMARQSWSKNRKRPHFASLPQANPSPESKNFFLNRTMKSSRICKAFEQLSSYCGWRVITKKPRANIFALVGVKGFGHLITMEGDEKSQQCHHYFLQYSCFRKISGSNLGAPNILLVPGHLTSLRPCAQCTCVTNIAIVLT